VGLDFDSFVRHSARPCILGILHLSPRSIPSQEILHLQDELNLCTSLPGLGSARPSARSNLSLKQREGFGKTLLQIGRRVFIPSGAAAGYYSSKNSNERQATQRAAEGGYAAAAATTRSWCYRRRRRRRRPEKQGCAHFFTTKANSHGCGSHAP
jgi:hypothetical protein